MMRMRKLLNLISIVYIMLVISACEKYNSNSHGNPLINKGIVDYLKNQMDINSPEDNPIAQCGSYYAGYLGTENFKNYCDRWSVNEFRTLRQNLNVTYKASIENLRDPSLWQIVIPKEKPALSYGHSRLSDKRY